MAKTETCKNMSKSFQDYQTLKNALYEQGFTREDLGNFIKNSVFNNTVDIFILCLLDVKLEITCIIEYETGKLFYRCACYDNKRSIDDLFEKDNNDWDDDEYYDDDEDEEDEDMYWNNTDPERYDSKDEVATWIKNQIKKIISTESTKD